MNAFMLLPLAGGKQVILKNSCLARALNSSATYRYLYVLCA